MQTSKLLLIFLIPALFSCQHLKSGKNNLTSARSNLKKNQIFPSKSKAHWIRETFKRDLTRPPTLQSIRPVLGAKILVIQGNKVSGVEAYTLDQGKKKWSFFVKDGLVSNILAQKSFVFFGAADGFIYSLYLSTGKLAWKYYTGKTIVSTPVIKGKYIYFTSSNKVYCLNKRTGAHIWTYSMNLKPREFVVEGVARPLLGKSLIYIKTGDGSLLALNFKGRLKWQIPPKYSGKQAARFTSATSAPVMGKKCLYYSNLDSGLFCVNKKTGRLIWKTNEGSHGDLLLSRSRLFYPTSEGHIRALDQKTGKEIWKYKPPSSHSITTGLVAYKQALIYGEYSGGALHALSRRTGQKLDSFRFGSGVSARPLVSRINSELYFMSNVGWLYKLKLN